MVSRASPQRQVLGWLHFSETHLHTKEASSIYMQTSTSSETGGALSPGAEKPQLSLFGTCTEICQGNRVAAIRLEPPIPISFLPFSTWGLESAQGLRSWGCFHKTPSSFLFPPFSVFTLFVINLKWLESQTSQNLKTILVQTLYRKDPEMKSRDADLQKTLD